MAVIAVDCDEVLIQTMHSINTYVKNTHNYDRVYEDMSDYYISRNPHMNISEAEAIRIFHDYYLSSFAADAMPVEGAFDVLKGWKNEGHKLLVVTARNESRQPRTEQQIGLHFPDIFDEIIYAHHFTEKSIPKSQICKAICADYFIDDHIENALDVADNGTQVFLMERPWNIGENIDHKHIQRVKNRSEISLKYV